MIEEMHILAKEQEDPLQNTNEGTEPTMPPGQRNSLFAVQTGEDFEDVDVLGTCVLQQSICLFKKKNHRSLFNYIPYNIIATIALFSYGF